MNISLLGKNALVGGASAGIGRAVAVELAALGANVILVAAQKTPCNGNSHTGHFPEPTTRLSRCRFQQQPDPDGKGVGIAAQPNHPHPGQQHRRSARRADHRGPAGKFPESLPQSPDLQSAAGTSRIAGHEGRRLRTRYQYHQHLGKRTPG